MQTDMKLATAEHRLKFNEGVWLDFLRVCSPVFLYSTNHYHMVLYCFSLTSVLLKYTYLLWSVAIAFEPFCSVVPLFPYSVCSSH